MVVQLVQLRVFQLADWPFFVVFVKSARSLSGSPKLRVTIKTNYIPATAGSSSFLSCPAFTHSVPTHLPVFLPHQPVVALCSFFFDSVYQCTPKSISDLGSGRRCAHPGFTWVPYVSAPMTTEPVWHLGCLLVTGVGVGGTLSCWIYSSEGCLFWTSLLLLVSIHLRWTMLLDEKLFSHLLFLSPVNYCGIVQRWRILPRRRSPERTRIVQHISRCVLRHNVSTIITLNTLKTV